MKALDRIVLQRASEQLSMDDQEPARRLVCACGCGRWWYRAPGYQGRDRRYATPLCKSRAGHKREQARGYVS